MYFKNWILLEALQTIGYAEMKERKLFGPIYHATTATNLEKINQQGFKVFIGGNETGDVANGYKHIHYHDQILPPIHHLGFGVYFTTKMSIAKNYNVGKIKLEEYYADIPRVEEINFAINKTMMRWWQSNGYDMPPVPQADLKNPEVMQQRIQSTINLTNNLKSKYDAVWFKGKGLKALLDGDQICIYDTSKIYKYDSNKNRTGDPIPNDRFLIRGTKATGTVLSVRENKNPDDWQRILGIPSHYLMHVKLDKKALQAIKDAYQDKYIQLVIPSQQVYIQNRMERLNITYDEALKDFLDYYFGRSLLLNFPSALIEKIVAKGERIR